MLHTRACTVLGIEVPIVQAGMARYGTNAALVAAVSTAGGLGVLGCLGRPAEEAVAEIERIRALTDRPFGVSFVVHHMDEDAFMACLEQRVPVFSFFRGVPDAAVARVHAASLLAMCQVTTVGEAIEARNAGADMLVAQGIEAGGHNGPEPLFALLPEVIEAAGDLPVLAAGGIVDGRGLAAVLHMGASGAQIGTRFLATIESPASPGHKQAILDAPPGATVATRVPELIWGDPWPGVTTRALRNTLLDRWTGREDELEKGLDAAALAKLQRHEQEDDPQEIILLAGAGAGRIRDLLPAGEVVRRLVQEAETVLADSATLRF